MRTGSLILLFILLTFVSSAQTTGEGGEISPENVDDSEVQVVSELELERGMSERLEHMLQPLIGPTVVVVDLSLSSTPVELRGFRYSRSQSLPGLPVSVSESAEPGAKDFVEITKIIIRVFVSEKMKDEEIDRITEMIPLWVRLNYARGDQILVEQVPFVNPPMTLVQFLLSWRAVTVAAIGFFILMVFLIIFYTLINPMRFVRDSKGRVHSVTNAGISGPLSAESVAQLLSSSSTAQDNSTSDRTKGRKSPGGDEAMGMMPSNMLTLPEGEIGVRIVRDSDSKRSLGVLSKIRNMPMDSLNKLLDGENAETIAFALQLAPSNFVADYLTSLHETTRKRIIAAWNELKNLDSESMKSIIDALRAKVESSGNILDYLPAAAERFADIINSASNQQARQLFEIIRQTNPQLALEVRLKVFFIDDLATLEDAALRRVLVNIPRNILAILLHDCPNEIREKIYSSLSPRMANMVREEMALVSNITPEMAMQAKTQLIMSFRKAQGVTKTERV